MVELMENKSKMIKVLNSFLKQIKIKINSLNYNITLIFLTKLKDQE